jgi:hypothetical protein
VGRGWVVHSFLTGSGGCVRPPPPTTRRQARSGDPPSRPAPFPRQSATRPWFSRQAGRPYFDVVDSSRERTYRCSWVVPP